MYEARQNKEKSETMIYRHLDNNEYRKLTQKKNNQKMVLQRTVTVNNNLGKIGTAGQDTYTSETISKNSYFFDDFCAQTPLETHGGKKRSRFHCAEPNALAKLISEHTQSQITNDLKILEFEKTKIAKKDSEIHYLSPCSVCRQWLTGNDKFKIKTDFLNRNSELSENMNMQIKGNCGKNQTIAQENLQRKIDILQNSLQQKFLNFIIEYDKKEIKVIHPKKQKNYACLDNMKWSLKGLKWDIIAAKNYISTLMSTKN